MSTIVNDHSQAKRVKTDEVYLSSSSSSSSYSSSGRTRDEIDKDDFDNFWKTWNFYNVNLCPMSGREWYLELGILHELLDYVKDVDWRHQICGEIMNAATHEEKYVILRKRCGSITDYYLGRANNTKYFGLPDNLVGKFVCRMLEVGVDPNAIYQERSILYYASKHNFQSAVKILLEKKAKVNTGGGGDTLYVALMYGHINIAKILVVDDTCDIDDYDIEGYLRICPDYAMSIIQDKRTQVLKILVNASLSNNTLPYHQPEYARRIIAGYTGVE
jgi:hypothetical protein